MTALTSPPATLLPVARTADLDPRPPERRWTTSGDTAWRIDPADTQRCSTIYVVVQRTIATLELLSLCERGITRQARNLELGMSDGPYRNARRRLPS